MVHVIKMLLVASSLLWAGTLAAKPAGDLNQNHILTFDKNGFFAIQNELLDLPDEDSLRAQGYGSQQAIISFNTEDDGNKKFYASVKLPIRYQFEETPLNIAHYSGTLDSEVRFLTLNPGQRISISYNTKKTIHFNSTAPFTEEYRASNQELHELVSSMKTDSGISEDKVLIIEYSLSQAELENLTKLIHFKLGQAAFVYLLQSRINAGGNKGFEPFESILFKLNSK